MDGRGSGRRRRRFPRGLWQQHAVSDDPQASGTLGHENRVRIGKRQAVRVNQPARDPRDANPLAGGRVEGLRRAGRARRRLGRSLGHQDGRKNKQRCESGSVR